jgi:predicted CxxxxCH...CXXCH cytochrome family protein
MIWTKKYLWLLFIGLLIIYLNQCSKLKKELPVEPPGNETELHETGWLDTLSTNFHGKYIRAHNWDLESCKKCHGKDYAGGSSNSSCNTSGCHPGTPEACTTCHGGALNQTGAPPKDIDNHYTANFKGVGVHTALVTNPRWSRAFDCTECHLKPAKLKDPGHIDSDLPAEIVFGELAKLDNLSPAWKDSTCFNVYCHGASLSGGTLTNLIWTQPGSMNCNTCHGIAPNTGAHEKHVENLQNDCNVCHDGYLKNGEVNKQMHIDGKRDVQMNATYGGTYVNGVCSNVSCHGSNSPNWTAQVELGCTSCHGGTDNDTGAPPVDLEGNTSRTAIGVGAHSVHVSDSQWGKAYDCTECHIKPVNASDPGHIDNSRPAEIVWGEFSKTGNLTPNWDGSKCENVYCHGGSLQDGSVQNPQWTRTESLTCDACHGIPPKNGAHEECVEESGFDCFVCHDGYSKESNKVNKEFHLNGKNDVILNEVVGGSYKDGVCSNVICHGVADSPDWKQDAVLSCISCHGGEDNSTGAPPIDLKGNTQRAARGVGAHTAHISQTKWARAFYCDECHIKPSKISDQWHIDIIPPAEITWGELAKTNQLNPEWNGTTCTNVYCHGKSLSGGTMTTPTWTSTESISCGFCHSLPPNTGKHEVHVEDYSFDCNFCHNGYIKNSSINLQTHIDGKKDVQFATAIGGSYANGVCSNVICHGGGNTPAWTSEADFTCISCHGGFFNNTGAPPFDLKGDTTTTVKGVGAHTIHIMGGKLSDGVECTECHIKPSETDSPGHIEVDLLPAEIIWGNLAKTDGATPSWDGVKTCQNVYCHGEFNLGNKNNDPVWINFAGTQPCGSCHGLPPASPHPQNTQCSVCHSAVVDASNNIVNKAKHINGQTDFQN